MAKSNKRNNIIEMLLPNGSISIEQEGIESHIVQLYDSLFKSSSKLDDQTFEIIGEEEASGPEWPFKEMEVLKVVNGEKDPSADGFSWLSLNSIRM